MEIILTKHVKDRAKERFGLKVSSLRRLVKKALKDHSKRDYMDECLFNLQYSHFKFTIQESKDSFIVITIVNFLATESHKESITHPLYLKGKKTKKTMRIRK